jgi:ketosteroid isomerase-like protein
VPSTDTVHRELCRALFHALEQGDVAGVERCYAPDMTMWFNVTGADITKDENLAAVARGADLHRRRT